VRSNRMEGAVRCIVVWCIAMALRTLLFIVFRDSRLPVFGVSRTCADIEIDGGFKKEDAGRLQNLARP
jgi:hypothetical protein